MREDRGEIEAAITHKLPRLVDVTDIKGDLHVHTNLPIATSHDEGVSSIGELLAEAERLGYEYIGFSDHNPRLEGLTDIKRKELIDKRKGAIEEEISSYEKTVKRKLRLKVLIGMEVDIRPKGDLALSDKLMEELDYVIASVHSVFNQGKEEATKRILAGLDHPKVKIWGHPSGRMLQQRLGLDYGWERVIGFCFEKKKLVEINAWPTRLDLSDELIKLSIEKGIKLIINSDSHGVDHLGLMKYGVFNARRGWAERKDIANALPWLEFAKLVY